MLFQGSESVMLGELSALAQVVFIDVVLAGDNAVVVAMAAAGVSSEIRSKVIFWGIAGAVILRIGMALVATQLLALVGLTLAGGILLLWVCWKMYREIVQTAASDRAALANGDHASVPEAGNKSFRQAMFQIVVADISMSLDNVLAVAGAARDHLGVLIVGLVLSIGLMGTAASLIASVLHRWRWLAHIGLLVILFVAGDMIVRGVDQIACAGVHKEMCDRGIIGFTRSSLLGL